MRISFKTKTTVWITLLITAVCAVSITGILIMGRNLAADKTKQNLAAAVEKNADEIEYQNGILEIESDFVFYSNGIYCDVYSKNFSYIDGEIPYALIDGEDFKDGETRLNSGENGDYYILDRRLDFNKYEYEIDVFSGQIITYEADYASAESLVPREYGITKFKDGIDTEQAIDIALEHAGADRSGTTVISVELPGYEKRQVFKIEFVCDKPLYDSVWIRGVVPASETDMFSVLNQTVLYIIPLFIILAAVGAYILSKQTIRPVEDISRSAKAISSGSDLSKRIEINSSSNEITALAETFNKMLLRLQESFESEKRFTSDASHELRTPLAVIKAECDYALSENADSADKEEALVSISEQTAKMTQLVNSLLSLTRTEQGTERFNFENGDLSLAVEEICGAFKPEKNISLETEIEKNISFRMDVSLISRMLENLLSNAVRYGGENGYIRVKLFKEKNNIILSVKDNGIGIKKEELPKIWGRFYRADSFARNGEGFGLGLALVERIAALHGGKADVNSVFGEGSEFIIKFSENC